MYCSLEEAWPHMNLQNNRNNKLIDVRSSNNTLNDNYYDDYKKNLEENRQEKKINMVQIESEKREHFDTKVSNDKCINIMDHISVCDECLQNLYKKYSSLNPIHNINSIGLHTIHNFFTKISNNFNNLVANKNKDVVSSILFGLLIILILQFLKSN
jgi:hypothetical protein